MSGLRSASAPILEESRTVCEVLGGLAQLYLLLAELNGLQSLLVSFLSLLLAHFLAE